MSASKQSGPTPRAAETAPPTKSMFEAAMTGPQSLVEANMRTFLEIFDFVSRRMKAQADFYDTLSHCREVGQIVETQQKFWDRASKEYADEAGHLADVAQENISSLAAAYGQAKKH